MPEGDTVHKLAAALRPLLLERPLLELSTRGGRAHPGLAGRRVLAIGAVGKHLLIDLEGPLTVRVHLGMHGRWDRYAPDERWLRSPRRAGLVLRVADAVAVCFDPQRVDLLTGADRRGAVAHLGPDLLGEDPDLEEAVRRARASAPGRPLGELLLDQTVAAGLGNVYKCELLHLEALSPFTPVAALSDRQLAGLFARGRALMQRNLGPGPRVTTGERGGQPEPDQRLHVYRRGGRPCRRCGARVARAAQGGRSTWWCPGCQRVPDPVGGAALGGPA